LPALAKAKTKAQGISLHEQPEATHARWILYAGDYNDTLCPTAGLDSLIDTLAAAKAQPEINQW